MTKIQYPRPFSSKTSEQGDPLEKQVMVDQTVTTIEEDIGLAAIKVVGVGGGGSNAVSRMYRERIPEVEYISVNTDAGGVMRTSLEKEFRYAAHIIDEFAIKVDGAAIQQALEMLFSIFYRQIGHNTTQSITQKK